MFLLVGLGNPGTKYAGNRHNAGFMAVDAIADENGFSAERSKFKGLLREGKLGIHKVLTLKPQTFYNEAGNAVAAAAHFHKIPVDDIIVFHDEIDLAPGKIRVKKGGGLAGNNGLKSTAAHMGPDFWRVRIGIGHPGRKEAVTGHVLGDFSKADREDWFDETLERMARAALHLCPPSEETAGRFMSGVAQPGTGNREKKSAQPDTKEKRAKTKDTQPAEPPAPEKSSSPFDLLKQLKSKD
ncbi:MAG: aminoacyl-tRNA hydrolase [Pseudomonadota bacterium]